MKSAVIVAWIVTWPVSAFAQPQTTLLRDAANREGIQLARAIDSRALQPTPGQPRSWPARHPVLTGTLVGLGIGFPIGAATCRYPGAEGPCSYYTFPGNARMLGGVTIGLLGAGIGAGIGALIGSFAP